MKRILPLITILMALALAIAVMGGCAVSPGKMASGISASRTEAAAPAPQMAGFVREDRAEAGVYDAPEAEMDNASAYPQEAPIAGGADSGGIAGPAVKPVIDSRKIIKNVDIQLQTMSFDSGVDSISVIAESFGGYVQDSYVTGLDMYNERGTRFASFTVRIPSEKLDAFVNSLGGEFNVLSKSQNSQDITDVYFDSKARLDALKIQEERLIAMLEKAEELEYLLQVEKELMNVRYELESLTASLARMDSYVSLSTVTIQLNEVVKYDQIEDVPVNFGERMALAFSSSWVIFSDFMQDLAVFLTTALPFLLLTSIAVLIIVLIVRRVRKGAHKKNKTSEQPVSHSHEDNADAQ